MAADVRQICTDHVHYTEMGPENYLAACGIHAEASLILARGSHVIATKHLANHEEARVARVTAETAFASVAVFASIVAAFVYVSAAFLSVVYVVPFVVATGFVFVAAVFLSVAAVFLPDLPAGSRSKTLVFENSHVIFAKHFLPIADAFFSDHSTETRSPLLYGCSDATDFLVAAEIAFASVAVLASIVAAFAPVSAVFVSVPAVFLSGLSI